jgi:hypothetical protein
MRNVSPRGHTREPRTRLLCHGMLDDDGDDYVASNAVTDTVNAKYTYKLWVTEDCEFEDALVRWYRATVFVLAAPLVPWSFVARAGTSWRCVTPCRKSFVMSQMICAAMTVMVGWFMTSKGFRVRGACPCLQGWLLAH